MIKVESKLRPSKPEPPPCPDPVPRVTQLLALAIKMEDMLARGEVKSQREMAEIAGVSAARVSQILRLLDLAPQLQERLLLDVTRNQAIDRHPRVMAK